MFAELRQLLAAHFSLGELQTLCFDLGIDYENLPGSTKGELARELIRYLNRQERLDELVARCGQLRPDVGWPEVPARVALDSPAPVMDRSTLARMWKGIEPGKRKILLDKVKKFWVDGVLARTIEEGARLDVSWKRETRFVDHPWDELAAGVFEKPSGFEGNDSVLDAFLDADRALLILGDPGSGKTILLLRLAQALIELAMNDRAEQAPVVLNLVSWDSSRASLEDWVVEELAAKYHIPQNIGRAWLEADSLLLLLDGLDEVRFNYQDDCVEAINRFRAERGLTGLVVCCRTMIYETIGLRLRFGGAIRLAPLTGGQVERYLDSHRIGHRQLKQALALDEELREMARSPLLLSLMSAIYKDDDDLTDSGLMARVETKSFRKQLFADYTQEMFRERGSKVREEVLGQLAYLAQKLEQHNQTIFLIDQLQPSWLPDPSWQRLYIILTRIASGLVIGIALWLGYVNFSRFDPDFSLALVEIFTEFAPLAFPWNVLLFEVVVHVALGVVTGVVDIILFEYWEKQPVMKAGRRLFIHLAVICSTVGLLTFVFTIAVDSFLNAFISVLSEGVSFFVLYYLVHGHSYGRDIRTAEPVRFYWVGALKGAILGLLFGILAQAISMDGSDFVSFALIFLLLGGFSGKGVEAESRPNQGIRQSIYNGILAIFVGGTVFALHSFIIYDGSIFAGVMGFVSTGLIAGYAFGLGSAGKHLMLRAMLRWSQRVPWNYEVLLDQAVGLDLLHRVGGGYMFVHRLLQEHFVGEVGVS